LAEIFFFGIITYQKISFLILKLRGVGANLVPKLYNLIMTNLSIFLGPESDLHFVDFEVFLKKNEPGAKTTAIWGKMQKIIVLRAPENLRIRLKFWISWGVSLSPLNVQIILFFTHKLKLTFKRFWNWGTYCLRFIVQVKSDFVNFI
jgi:hypothetical protein